MQRRRHPEPCFPIGWGCLIWGRIDCFLDISNRAQAGRKCCLPSRVSAFAFLSPPLFKSSELECCAVSSRRGKSAGEVSFVLDPTCTPHSPKLPSRGRSERHAPCYHSIMVIAIILASWLGLSTIICLAFARVAARPRPLVSDNVSLVGEDVPLVGDGVSRVGNNVTAKVETSGRPTRNPELEAVCATS